MRWFLFLLCLLIAAPSWAGEGRIYAQRVSATGSAIGSPVVVYNGVSGSQSRPEVAFYNDRFLVVWSEWNGSDLDVKAARLAMDGTILDTTPLDIDTGARNQMSPDVAADSSGWMVVNSGFQSTALVPSIYARRVDYDGTVQTPIQFGHTQAGANLPLAGSYPRIAWDPVTGKHLVMFTTIGYQYGPALRWHLLTKTPTNENPGNSDTAHDSQDTHYPIAMVPGGGWTMMVADRLPTQWGTGTSEMKAKNITSTGGEGSTGILDDNRYSWEGVDVATDASYVIGVWNRYTGDGPNNLTLIDGNIYASRIDGNSPVDVVGGVAVATTTDVEEIYPRIEGDGAGNLLVAYEKITDGSAEIASKILNVDGGGITSGSEVILRTDTTGARRGQIAVAYGDDGVTQEFLVVWVEGWWGTL